MKEINVRLTEGVECKELLKNKNSQIRVQDKIIVSKDSQLAIVKEIAEVAAKKAEVLKEQNATLQTDVEKKKKDLASQKRKKRIWQSISVGQALLIIILIL